jgi:hypothetical protein
MPTHLGGDYLSPFKLAFEIRSKRALTERPACFEIDPRGVRSSAPFRMWCRPQLITAINCGSISSSRCQTTRLAGSKIAAKRISVHGRAKPRRTKPRQARPQVQRARGTTSRAAGAPTTGRAPHNEGLVEPDGIEPTTSCLQSTRSPN